MPNSLSPAASYDAIVVGLGALGSALLGELARSGYKVLGIDRHLPPHNHGSSHGNTRLIRKAYFEDERYIPLLTRAYRGWDALAQRTHTDLLRRTGLLVYGEKPDLLTKLEEQGKKHEIELHTLSLKQARQKAPGIHFPNAGAALFEPDAGYLRAESCIEAMLEDASQGGATLRPGRTLESWTPTSQGFQIDCAVQNQSETYQTQSLFFATGAFPIPGPLGASEDRALWPFPLRLFRAPQFWFPATQELNEASGLPCFAFDVPEGFFYGFPANETHGLKVAPYEPTYALEDPTQMASLTYRSSEIKELNTVVQRFFPQVDRSLVTSKMCMYALSPDENFLLDEHPEFPGLFLLGAGSGHAFKFAPALAEIMRERLENRVLPAEAQFLGWR